MKQPVLKRVLLVSGVYPPAVGGPSLQTKRIAQEFMARGLQVQVLTYGDPQQSGVLDQVPVQFLDATPQSSWPGKLRRNWRVYRTLNHVIRQFQPDLIHMQTAAGNLALMTGIAARRHRIPALIKYTADLVFQKADLAELTASPNRQWSGRSPRLTHAFQCCLFALYDSVWATTPLFQKRLIQHYRVPSQKTFLLPNFIDLEPFEVIAIQRKAEHAMVACNSPKKTILLTVARLFPVKGLDVYLRAIAQLPDLPLEVRIIGSGSTDYEAFLRDLGDRLGLADRIHWMGAIPPEHIAAEYRTADVFVLPSRHEPFGIVLLEAMAAGLPVLATRVDGIPFVVEEGISAYLVPPDDDTALAAAIRHLVVHQDIQEGLAIAGRQRVKRFGLSSSLTTLESIYRTLQQPARRSMPLLNLFKRVGES